MAHQKLIIVCQCGKRYQVKHRAVAAAFVCKDCGQTIQVPVSDTKQAQHWSFNVLWMVWAIPVCILVAGIFYILIVDGGRKPEPAAISPDFQAAKITADTPDAHAEVADDSLFAMRERVIFPEDHLNHIDSLNIVAGFRNSINVNSKFKQTNNTLVSQDGETNALQLSGIVSDFNLKIKGDFAKGGAMNILLGWDNQTNSGYVIQHDRLVNYGHWWLSQVMNGKPLRTVTLMADVKISQGELRLKLSNNQLSIDFGNKVIVSKFPLPDYHPGIVAFGTGTGRYPGKRMTVESINIVETPAREVAPQKVISPTPEMFSKTEFVKIFPGGSFRRPVKFPMIGLDGSTVVRNADYLTMDGDFLVSKSGVTSVIELDALSQNFELTITGEMSDKGILYWLIGWNQATSTGYRTYHNQLIASGSWLITTVDNGVAQPATTLVNKRLPVRSEIILRVVDKVLEIEVDQEVLLERFVLEDYQPGSLFLGTASERYGGRKDQSRNKIRLFGIGRIEDDRPGMSTGGYHGRLPAGCGRPDGQVFSVVERA